MLQRQMSKRHEQTMHTEQSQATDKRLERNDYSQRLLNMYKFKQFTHLAYGQRFQTMNTFRVGHIHHDSIFIRGNGSVIFSIFRVIWQLLQVYAL